MEVVININTIVSILKILGIIAGIYIIVNLGLIICAYLKEAAENDRSLW